MQFYALRDTKTAGSTPANYDTTRSVYDYLDHLPSDDTTDTQTMGFYVEGMHCAACVWLLEQLPQLVPGVESVRIQLGHSLAWVTIQSEGSFSQAAQMMAQLGYPPHPLQNPDTHNLQRENQRSQLLRLGIAGFSAANIMLFSVSVYAGVTDPFKTAFYWIMFGLLLPTLLYSARPFFKTALTALSQRRFDMDIPVSFALIMGSISSVVALIQGTDHVYFDSLSMFIFLLLLTRHFYKQAYLKADMDVEIFSALVPQMATQLVSGKAPRSVFVHSLVTGDTIRVAAGDVLPVDGVLLSANASIETQLLTGEADPGQFSAGETLYAGTRNCGPDIDILVEAMGDNTRLSHIFKQAKTVAKPQIIHLADRLGQYLLAVTLFSSIGLILWQSSQGDFWLGFNQSMALIILACPCALALATPLTVTLANKQAIQRGLLLRQSDIFERLRGISTCFIDKTGTLTQGSYDVISWEGDASPADLAAIDAIESQSKHPVARAICLHLRTKELPQSPPATHIEETLGTGISGTVGNHIYRLESASAVQEDTPPHLTLIDIMKDTHRIARIALSDALRADAKESIKFLQSQNITPIILSGDRPAVVSYWAQELGIDDARGALSPEDKATIVQKTPNSLMIGDGANDALALSSAQVSAAVHGCLESSLAVSDCYFLTPGLTPLQSLFDVSRGTWRALKITLGLSLVYNTLGISAIFLFELSPIIAAVLMPLSSLTVFIAATVLTGERFLWKS